eukprot:CAMPEP_0197438536 /NCGR_PEP_ID=MMETSP1175-20131217/5506_1 /TAXON_ID=1003142 /ORGANISM="Triceratium dubium, Strain CCMP147" /LENGTH=1314 /DNA_ID=CAMNT_0042968287 /DNA_START=186 /DNA_END=4130 /DNA_ORIENTATION=+
MNSYQQGSQASSSDATLLANNTSRNSGANGPWSSNGSDSTPVIRSDHITCHTGPVQPGSTDAGAATGQARDTMESSIRRPAANGRHIGNGGSFPEKRAHGFSHRYPPGKKKTGLVVVTISASVLALILCAKSLLFPSHLEKSPEGEVSDSKVHSAQKGGVGKFSGKMSQLLFDDQGRYVLEDFDAKPTFSDFLPGVAGIYGKPMWSFYVNRGQGIASFGSKSKDYPIMEFSPANKAYQNTATLGFRTFIDGRRGSHSFFLEPFASSRTRYEGLQDETHPLPKRVMFVGANEMQISETDFQERIETNVTYFVLPEEDFGAFVRRTTITNLDKEQALHLSLLDGLAKIEPAGGKLDALLKDMGRTLEGFFGVYQAHEDVKTMPFFRMSTEPTDAAAVKVQNEGHYLLSFIEGEDSWLLPIVFDTKKVFGEDTMMLHPVGLQTSSVRSILNSPQYGFAKTSSAFAAVDNFVVPPGSSVTIASFYGKTDDIMNVPVIARKVVASGFVQYKLSRSREVIQQITAGVETNTINDLFNLHAQQMYMDNSLRGGVPVILGDTDDDSMMNNADEDERLKVFSVFSRVHGDLERDYNDFLIEPTFYSEGPGNFRDVAQNRRNDVILNPRIGGWNLKVFLSFIQADGYQPSSVEAVVFTIADKSTCDDIATQSVGHADGVRAQREALSRILNDGPFRPGQLFLLMEQQHIELIVNRHTFVHMVAAAAEISPMAVAKVQGFWADHWTYFIDLVETYLSIYPDKEHSLMYDERLPYFFSPLRVRPRCEKYVLSLSYGGGGKHVRQLEAVVKDGAKERVRLAYFNNKTGWYDPAANWQHDSSGKVFMSSPIARLFVLAAIKFATRDVYGMGIEYEANKPGWNDAMNGLAGMIGSGMPETFELLNCIRYVLSVVTKFQEPIVVPVEAATLVDSINDALDELAMRSYVENPEQIPYTVPDELFQYWDAVSNARERYRSSTVTHFSGVEKEISVTQAVTMLERWIDQVESGVSRSLLIGSQGDGDNGLSGLSPTYFSFNVTKWTLTGKKNKDGHPLVAPNQMKVGKFPLFLEGPVRMMKSSSREEAYNIYERVRKSGLWDGALNMYTISASLKGQSYDMGRVKAFAPGWLENQSVWLHMSYKFYLELIRNGLYEQFYTEMTSGGMLPFMEPEVYGRSILECSSFIVSSAFSDPSMHGRGFVARLSGSTAEFLSMWSLMFLGPQPFFIDDKEGALLMQLKPALPLWLFENEKDKHRAFGKKSEASVKFKLFSSIDVTYHNTARKDLFGNAPLRYEIGLLDGSVIPVEGGVVPSDLAIKIRRVVFVDCIDAYF